MLKTLSLIVTEAARDMPALVAAVDLTLRHDAHLDVTCLAVERTSIGTLDGVPPILTEAHRTDAATQTHALAVWARAALPTRLSCSVRPMAASSSGLIAGLAQTSHYSDLAVTVRPYGPKHGWVAPLLMEALLFRTGVPVLVLPDVDPMDWSRPFRRLCLAWDGSDEAICATRTMLPFLREVLQVEIAIVGSPPRAAQGTDPTAALQRWLARHWVKAAVTWLPQTRRSKAEILTRFALEQGCEALVMGAYGHSRLRETLLGGTTHAMLTEVPLPLLMAHRA